MKLTIRWSLIICFLCLIWGTYVVTTTSTYISSEKVLNNHARAIMGNIADLAMEKSQNQDTPELPIARETIVLNFPPKAEIKNQQTSACGGWMSESLG